MEMYDVLSKLKAIENPNEDQVRAIENAEKMNNPTNPSATNALMPETNTISATGQEVYQPVAEESPVEYARLAGIQTLNVQTDAPDTTNESVETIEEAKPDFLDLDKDGDKEESMKKAAKDKEEMKEEDTTPEQYEKNERVSEEVEEIELDEAYDPIHVADIVKKHEKEGNKVQMDRPEDDAQGFTVTFKDGKKRHYKYHKGGVKVQSMEPEDPMVDPDAPKRERGRPKKEDVEIAEKVQSPYAVGMAQAMKSTGDEPPLKKSTIKKAHKIAKAVAKESELNLDSMMEEFERKYAEQLNEGLQVTQSIDDEGKENININANNAHADMIKELLKLSGMRSDGYKEYQGQEEPVEEERDPEYTNSPREKTTTVDAQLKDMSGGLNGPKDKSALKSNSNALHTESKNDIAENMMNLYAKYKAE